MNAQQTGQTTHTPPCVKRLSRRKLRRRPSWVGRFRRLSRALSSATRMIDATMVAVNAAAERALDSPVRTTRELHRLSLVLIAASIRLDRAIRGLSETSDAVFRDPRQAGDAARLLVLATHRWIEIANALSVASDRLFGLQERLLDDLESGALRPEAEPPRRRRIPIARLLFAREFLRRRQSRAHDRIALIPLRRRRTACRATTDAPRRISRGRAPPFSSNCLL